MILEAVFILSAINTTEECKFVQWWADRALYALAHGLEEDRWHIFEEGFPPDLYKIIINIRREAYHDQPALHKRVKAACEVKVNT